MADQVSPFIVANKSWLMRKIIADYLYAKNLFTKLFQDYKAGGEVPYEKMKKFSELLFTAKEDLHLLFEREKDDQDTTLRKSFKYIPNDDVIDFMNNVGLLFHKAMVARELKYMLEVYKTDSEDYINNKELLDSYVVNMRNLFKTGIEKAKAVLQDNDKNQAVILYMIESERYVTNAFGEPLGELMAQILGKDKVDDMFVQMGKLCLQSGWPERAFKIFTRALEENPDNVRAKEYLDPATSQFQNQVDL